MSLFSLFHTRFTSAPSPPCFLIPTLTAGTSPPQVTFSPFREAMSGVGGWAQDTSVCAAPSFSCFSSCALARALHRPQSLRGCACSSMAPPLVAVPLREVPALPQSTSSSSGLGGPSLPSPLTVPCFCPFLSVFSQRYDQLL